MPEAGALTKPLREGIRLRRTPDPCAMVIFGASGDLTKRKIIPALFYLAREGMLAPGFPGFAPLAGIVRIEVRDEVEMINAELKVARRDRVYEEAPAIVARAAR